MKCSRRPGSFLFFCLKANWEEIGKLLMRENLHRVGRTLGNQRGAVYRLSSSEGDSAATLFGETQGSGSMESREDPGRWIPPKETQQGGCWLLCPFPAGVTAGMYIFCLGGYFVFTFAWVDRWVGGHLRVSVGVRVRATGCFEPPDTGAGNWNSVPLQEQ